MAAVTTLNAAFSAFDDEIQTPMVYKVETVGHVYMAVSGAPDLNPLHAEHAADLALNMIRRVKALNLPGVTVKIGKCFSYTNCLTPFCTIQYLRNTYWFCGSGCCWNESTTVLLIW